MASKVSSRCPHPWSYVFEGFPAGVTPDWRTSNIAAVSGNNGIDLIGKALKTTRDRQIDGKKKAWAKNLLTRTGARRRRLTGTQLQALASGLSPTTLFDLLYRLRIRSNYDEADAFVSGAVTSLDASAFHAALCDIVAATLLTVEIHLAHQTSTVTLRQALGPLAVPADLQAHSVVVRQALW